MKRIGAPTWIVLSTPNIEESARFYSAVFGWEISKPVAALAQARIASVDGAPVAALYPAETSSWMVFLRVEEVHAAVEKCIEHGAAVVTEATDLDGYGAFAVVEDPTGAQYGLWQARDFTGFPHALGPGLPAWFEIMTTDFQRAKEYYQKAHDWKLNATEEFYAAATSAGICDAHEWFDASVWRHYILVPDTNKAVEVVTAHGGKLLDGPLDSPYGLVATISDSQGAHMQIVASSQ